LQYAEIKAAADYVQSRHAGRPTVGLILGSGLNPLAEALEAATLIPYKEIPHFPHANVAGHAGRLLLGQLAGHELLVMQGRAHFYEGYSSAQITLPVRVMQALAIPTLIVTNASGGINPTFRVGDLMLIVDQINLTGHNPLRGPNLAEFGPRFPSMTHPYHPDLMHLARQAATHLNIPLREGVYAGLAGPSFETPAEIRFLRTIGADAVGMSTVPEVIVANHGGMRVLGISSISNIAVQEQTTEIETTHEEVLASGQTILPKLTALLQEILRGLDESSPPQ
jgi:purine-nucleoside phosphorylase